MTMIKGKFYRFKSTSDDRVYMFKHKALLEKADSVDDEYHIVGGEFIVSLLLLCSYSRNTLEEISIEDIVQYLPDNHIDKLQYNRKKKINLLLDDSSHRTY